MENIAGIKSGKEQLWLIFSITNPLLKICSAMLKILLRNSIPPIILLFTAGYGYAQTLCAPFYIIGESNKGKIWKAVFSGCMDMQLPILNQDDDPAVTANMVRNRKIRKVIQRDPKRSTLSTTWFDEQGYKFFTGISNDTSNGYFLLNTFNEDGVLSLVTLKERHSISGLRGKDADTLYTKWTYTYNPDRRLIRKQDIRLESVKKYKRVRGKEKARYYRKPRENKFTTTSTFDEHGNIIATSTSQGSRDTFLYDTANRLLTAIDISENLANGETWHFAYNDKYLVDTIRVSYKDSVSFKPYLVCLAYDEEQRLTGFTKYYADGKVWEDITFHYSKGLLTEVKDCICNSVPCSGTRYDYDDNGLIRAATEFRNGAQTDQLLYTYEFYP